MTLTATQLKAIMPRVSSARWVGPLNSAMQLFQIDRPQRAAAFLAQIAIESVQLTTVVENLTYSTAERICDVWPTRFPSPETAAPYVRNPRKLGNFVYANRLGNGNEASGDGFKYRGRGPIQTTGRSNYRATGAALLMNLEVEPELLETPQPGALAAAWFWNQRGCNELADGVPAQDDADFRRITAIINGPAMLHLKERREVWHKAVAVLGA